MASIDDLPENVLLELFSLVPARELLRHCRPVCSLWRDLIDQVSFWKRKCLQEGFISEEQDQPVDDWKVFYFLCSLHRNLIRNPCGKDGLCFWVYIVRAKIHWTVENIPGHHGKEFPDTRVRECFLAFYGDCLKFQSVNLKDMGYSNELMDTVRPDIVIKDWFAPGPTTIYDRPWKYHICVRLLSADFDILDVFELTELVADGWSNSEWREVSHTFSNYPPGVRYIDFHHGGRSPLNSTRPYVFKVTNSSITIGPENLACRSSQMQQLDPHPDELMFSSSSYF
ncbi:F-box only protein 44-like [Dromiciops gliroides]|uniref:F-box only protein 44-like n=1 Tax=Dromiciops gliroides TaxID=33562 RepID=UPI001CC4664F|nr:F-box only protein 44-like [Dromiciops gliroides]